MTPSFLTDAHRRLLVGLARASVEAAVHGLTLSPPELDDPALVRPAGAFVTLRHSGQLRGCIGRVAGDLPVYLSVWRAAYSSAREDPRFYSTPLLPTDLPHLAIEISVLSALERLIDPLDFELGTHGILVRREHLSGMFLPQVGPEMRWTAVEMLSYCCAHKAGLPEDAWKSPDVEVFRFSADVIHEHEHRPDATTTAGATGLEHRTGASAPAAEPHPDILPFRPPPPLSRPSTSQPPRPPLWTVIDIGL